MRVLVADDDSVYRALLGDLLGHWGFEAVIVADGVQAREQLRTAAPFQIVLLDWMMPGLDGYTLCRRIKNETATQDTYVIMLTGSGRKDELIKVIVAGADDYIIKPFEPLDLKMRLLVARRIIELRGQLAELRDRCGLTVESGTS